MLPERKNVRLKEYDYSDAGYYFVTICTEGKKSILGEVVIPDNATNNETTVGADPSGSPKNGAPNGSPSTVHILNPGDPWEYSVGLPYTKLFRCGEIVLENIQYIQNNVKNFGVDCFCIMPNHVHIMLHRLVSETVGGDPLGAPQNTSVFGAPDRSNGAPDRSPPTGIRSIPQLISAFKRFSNKQAGIALWQRNYYEHIIRNEQDLFETRKYILENPLKWTLDKYYGLP